MKDRYIVSIIPVLALLLAFQSAGPKPAAAAPAKEAKAAPVTKATSQAEWDSLVKAAQKEGRVVIYGASMGDASGHLKKAFSDRYGIEMEFQVGRGSGEIVQRLLTERRAGLYAADMGNGGLLTFFNVITPANIALPLEPMIMLDEIKDPAKWRIGRIPFLGKKKQIVAPASMTSHYIAVNGDMVKEGEITSFDDLLDPKWKGKIVINNPTIPGRGNNWFSYMMLQLYGKETGPEYMKKLLLNQPMVLRDERLQVEWVAKKKYPVLVAGKQTIVQSFISAGAPLKWVKLKGAAMLSSGSFYLYAYQNAPHPNAQKVFLNWMLSKEAGEIIAKTGGFPSERIDVSRAGFDPTLLPGPNDVMEDEDYTLQSLVMPGIAAKIFKDILQ